MDESAAEVYRKHADDLLRMTTMMVGTADAHDVFIDAVLLHPPVPSV